MEHVTRILQTRFWRARPWQAPELIEPDPLADLFEPQPEPEGTLFAIELRGTEIVKEE